jgi:spore coat polysaccharide biosynthesis protein SpsF|tara:strand:- start:106 stop:786 length:681 start_codon:yes stop_codon:yes gene_type:complete
MDIRPLLIITARIGSKRLPGKVLKPFWKDYSILEFLIKRLQTRHETSRITLATVDSHENDPIVDIGNKCGIKVVRGSEENVLERVFLAVKGEDVEYVGRITADNPFTDPELILLQWEEMRRIKADYSYCKESPKGSAADIWTVESFESSVEKASTYYELEHINAWVWDHLEDYKVHWFVPPPKYISPDLSLSIDTNDEFVCMSNCAMSFEDPLRASINDLIKISMS